MQTQILGLLTPLMALLFAATFAVFWRAGRMKRHVLGFALGYLSFSIGFLVTHFLPGDGFYTFHTTQAFYTLGVTFFLGSVCERVGQRLHLPTIATIYAISALVLALAISFTNDAGPALILVNIGYGAMYMVGLTTLIGAQRRDWSDIAIIFLIAFSACDFFIRPSLTVMFEQTIPAGEYQQSVYYSLIGLVLGVKSIMGAMILIGATIVEWTNTLRESSEKDPLTGLNNRAAFEDSMRSVIPRAQNEGRPFSLVVADIDLFKQVNDIWGHQAGDQAISGFGGLIKNMIRGCDTAGRIGGEEFCIAVWNCENEPAERLAERIRQAFARYEHEGLSNDIRLTASFGVATARDGETYEHLFARADEALYRAKSSGRNRVENADQLRLNEVTPALTDELVEMKRAATEG
ncbi:GGDEF domain-containing protein [uncultured Erythrobacter sp.]|uniref:GGDEF domain-containing protein n=1 Tax=uncultured Erythrobacter sp. TaxID=263913 RepID=UPI002619F49E|nr:GGDEF domain-containing protein [uncultured Erythrobacter sp.]